MIDPVRTRNIPVERIFIHMVRCPFPLDSHQKARFLELSMPTQKNAPAFAAGAIVWEEETNHASAQCFCAGNFTRSLRFPSTYNRRLSQNVGPIEKLFASSVTA